MAWAVGFGFLKVQARPMPTPGQHFWLGLAFGLRPSHAHHYSNDCNPTAIVTATVSRTTNVSIVTPYFVIINFSSEDEEDLILTVGRYVYAMCFIMPVLSCSSVLMLSGPVFTIHFSLIPNSPQVTFNTKKLHPFIHCISFSHTHTLLLCPVSPLSAFCLWTLHWSCNINHWN